MRRDKLDELGEELGAVEAAAAADGARVAVGKGRGDDVAESGPIIGLINRELGTKS